MTGASRLGPDFDQPRSWKEQPIDVRAEAAAQVGPQRRGEVIARRVTEWREQLDSTTAGASHCPVPCEPGAAGAAPTDRESLRTPEVRRRRRRDPYYPSSWYLWRGEKGKAYVRAWESYSWGMSKRPEPWAEFSRDKARQGRP
ncbi:MAG: hypothetical protein WEB05_06925 [Solirubrobacterales bacterium]